VRDIDEETHLHLVYLFLVLPVFPVDFQPGFHTLAFKVEPDPAYDKGCSGCEKEDLRPYGLIPYRQDLDVEDCRPWAPFPVIVGGLDHKPVSSLRNHGI